MDLDEERRQAVCDKQREAEYRAKELTRYAETVAIGLMISGKHAHLTTAELAAKAFDMAEALAKEGKKRAGS